MAYAYAASGLVTRLVRANRVCPRVGCGTTRTRRSASLGIRARRTVRQPVGRSRAPVRPARCGVAAIYERPAVCTPRARASGAPESAAGTRSSGRRSGRCGSLTRQWTSLTATTVPYCRPVLRRQSAKNVWIASHFAGMAAVFKAGSKRSQTGVEPWNRCQNHADAVRGNLLTLSDAVVANHAPALARFLDALDPDGPATRLRHRHRALRVRRRAEDPRRDRRSGCDRENPHAPGPAGPGAAARPGAGACARPRGLICRSTTRVSAAEPTNSHGLWLRSTLNMRRSDAAPDDAGTKKLSSPAQFAGIFPHDRAIDRSVKGVNVPAGESTRGPIVRPEGSHQRPGHGRRRRPACAPLYAYSQARSFR